MKKNLYKKDYMVSEKRWEDRINYRTSWNIYPTILEEVKVKKEDKILDAGCGTGELVRFFRRNEVHGLDFVEESVEEAKKHPYKRVVLGDIENLQFKNNEFDASFSIQVFQYLENPEKAFKEILRVTKKVIIITVPNFKFLKIKSLLGGKHKRQYDYCIKYQNITDVGFLDRIAKKHCLKVRTRYLSKKFGRLRNLFGNYLSSELLAVYSLKKSLNSKELGNRSCS